ncbi:MAG: glycosyltransferase family 4 protein [Acidobacteriota bacterium]|nr:MAG: glycosyltransferase family 4 protein [Acidobacteriota bacterium]
MSTRATIEGAGTERHVASASMQPASRRWPPLALICHFPPPPGGMPGLAEFLAKSLESEQASVFRLRTNLGSSWLAQRLDAVRGVRSFLRLVVFLVRLAVTLPRVELLHVLSHSGLGFFLFTVPVVLAGRASGRRVIVNYHGGMAAEFFDRWPRVTQFVLRRAEAIVVPSGYLEQVFSQRGLDAHVVPNVCDLEPFRGTVDRPRRPEFVCARHLEPIYNNACVVRAFARILRRHPQARLYLLGGGPDAPAIAKLVRELGLEQAVELPGYVNRDDVVAYYRRASFLLNGSNVDNAPMAILEAFAAGLPVISTAAGGIPHLVRDGETGFIIPLDDDRAMAERAERLLADPSLARAMAERASEQVAEYEWSHLAADWHAIYVGRQPAGGASREEERAEA